jgi:hypothetical protein
MADVEVVERPTEDRQRNASHGPDPRAIGQRSR